MVGSITRLVWLCDSAMLMTICSWTLWCDAYIWRWCWWTVWSGDAKFLRRWLSLQTNAGEKTVALQPLKGWAKGFLSPWPLNPIKARWRFAISSPKCDSIWPKRDEGSPNRDEGSPFLRQSAIPFRQRAIPFRQRAIPFRQRAIPFRHFFAIFSPKSEWLRHFCQITKKNNDLSIILLKYLRSSSQHT